MVLISRVFKGIQGKKPAARPPGLSIPDPLLFLGIYTTVISMPVGLMVREPWCPDVAFARKESPVFI